MNLGEAGLLPQIVNKINSIAMDQKITLRLLTDFFTRSWDSFLFAPFASEYILLLPSVHLLFASSYLLTFTS